MPVIERKFATDIFFARYQVGPEHDGMRLDQYIQLFVSGHSREQIKEKIKKEEIIIENRPQSKRPSSKLKHLDIIKVTIIKTTHEDEYWRGEKIELQSVPDIIFEDEELLVIHKPAFMATHPTGKHLFNCATVFFEQKYQKTIHSIHRLDRETSGIQLLGKNSKISNIMMEVFDKGKVKKCYFWMARYNKNKQSESEFWANERLGSTKSGLERVIVNAYPEDSKQGKHAKTLFKVLHLENGYSFGLAFPITGRQHQIRVHAKVHGHPLVGDKLYLGGYPMFQRFKDNIYSTDDCDFLEIPRHALHAMTLKFEYKNKQQTFHCALPEDFKAWYKNKNFLIDISDLEKKSISTAQTVLDYPYTHPIKVFT